VERAAESVNEAVGRFRESLEMIKFSHTVFALPFAILAYFRASGPSPSWRTLTWVVVAMVGARTAAMAFNRIADRAIDAENPRTASRALPAGRVPLRFAVALCAVSSALFLIAAFALNRLAFALAFPTLALLFGYSFTKRFTSLSHLVLGLCLGIAPVGAWVAVRGRIEWSPVALGLAVLLWTAGFDVLYALADEDVDRARGLWSLPVQLGSTAALRVSTLFHVGTLVFLVLFDRAVGGGPVMAVGIGLAAAALAVEHVLVRPGDLSRLNAAFFTANGVVSVAVGLLGIADLWIPVR
jgi:4-hydroxybenzoate polyprenyltransferase